MNQDNAKRQHGCPSSHGTGEFELSQFRRLGRKVVFERGVLVFHPENIEIGDGVYVGHNAMLKGYYQNSMRIGAGSWIGQQCFLHSVADLTVGENVGIGPGVKIITSYHRDEGISVPILHSPIEFAPVVIGSGTDIGVGAIILPGVRVGRGVQVGAGAVVTHDVPDFAVVVGVPAKILRFRQDSDVIDAT